MSNIIKSFSGESCHTNEILTKSPGTSAGDSSSSLASHEAVFLLLNILTDPTALRRCQEAAVQDNGAGVHLEKQLKGTEKCSNSSMDSEPAVVQKMQARKGWG